MSDIINFSSAIDFTGAQGTLTLEDDYNLNNGNPPFVYKQNYDRYFKERSENLQLVPQDLSLFKKTPDPIKIPTDLSTTYSNDYLNPTINYADPNNVVPVDDFSDLATNTTNEVNAKDLGAQGKKVSKDSPEELPLDSFFEESDDEYYKQSDDNGTVAGQQNQKNTQKINSFADAKTNQKSKPAFTENLDKISISPKSNELNIFSSVSYNIALYMMNSKSYVDITKAPNNPQEVLDPSKGHSQLLMRSGGTGLDNTGNDFSNEFFIDDLEIQNIAVGPDKFRHNTNATNIRFTITEPRGVTLLEKLQRLAGTVLVSTRERYIHAPFLLEIKFKGYDETGRPMPAPSAPKYIPIRITDMKFEVNSSGTQYRVEAIPFANTIFGGIVSTIPHNIELKASTVGDIFNSEVQQTRQVADRIANNPGLAQAAGVQEGGVILKTKKTKHKDLAEILTDSRRRRTKPTKTFDSNGKETEVKPAAEAYDTYNFLIAEEISQAKLNLNDIYDALNTPVETTDEKKDEKNTDQKQYETYVKGLTRGISLDKETKTFSIAAGTDITKLINLVIMHSDYMDRNIEDNPTQNLQTGNPINWFRIRPIILSATSKGGGYDNLDGRYKYDIQYVVEKNVIHYHDFPWAKKSKPVGIGYHKKYDFIFSGQNTEVLDFDLKFNTAFVQVMTAGTGKPFGKGEVQNANSPFVVSVKELPSSSEGNLINSKDELKRTRAKDLFSSVMSDGVDLVNLDMRIVGDPAWIPTSDAYWQDKVRKGEAYTTAFMPDGTINYNLTPPFIQVNLRTPVDYDETTGLQDPSKAGNSSFSGVYRITMCESTFSGGVFQQRLEGFRPPGQDADLSQLKNYNKTRSTTQRKGLLDTVQDAIINKKQIAGQNVAVIEDQFEDFDYDEPMDGVI